MLKFASAAALLLLWSASASAAGFGCFGDRASHYLTILTADAVFVGEMQDYTMPSRTEVPADVSERQEFDVNLTFRVSESLKGDVSDVVEVWR